MTRTDTTLGQDRRTESNCVCMCTVQRRVIVDNKCEFQHSSSHSDCNSDARLVSKTRKYQQTDISEIRQGDFRSPTQVQHTQRKTRSHLAECEFVKNSSVMQTDSCSTIPARQIGQMRFVQSIQSVEATNCSCTNTAKS